MITKVDEFGRITLPDGYAEALGIKQDDDIEIGIYINEIRIRKLICGCVFCNAAVDLVRIGDICACRRCIGKLHNAKDGDYLYPTRND